MGSGQQISEIHLIQVNNKMINSIKIITKNITSMAMYMWIKTKYISYQYENGSAIVNCV